ncbi:MAG: hypothetical protein HQL20_08495 [Candidatus Omnitrophica bacterium]|nr:hypothetical protein [Candidatus Omnitrophota bacterium]
MTNLKDKFMFRVMVGWIICSFFGTVVLPQGAYAQVLNLPSPGVMVAPSAVTVPVLMKGLRVHPDNPLLFDFIMDAGQSGLALDSTAFRDESQKLVKYFLASLTIKEDDQWVTH